jgi:hypothetical protein
MSTYNFAIEAVAASSTKNMFAASSDGANQIMGSLEYASAQQSLAAGATVTFPLTGNLGLSGVYYVQADVAPFSTTYSIGAIGTCVSVGAAVNVYGIGSSITVPGGTITINAAPTGISISASGGCTGGPFLYAVGLNRIGSAS